MEKLKKKKWTREMVLSEAKRIADSLGHFPSNEELRKMGRTDLSCKITKEGGYIAISNEIGAARKHSDSDTGWGGEANVRKALEDRSYVCEGPDGIKSPFDILVNGCVRVDVKSARYVEYGPCCGWFYRIGKYVQSDIVILHQNDTEDNYILFWWEVTASNMTISRSGGKYASCKNAYWKIDNYISSISEIKK
jgi:hypothetical protein